MIDQGLNHEGPVDIFTDNVNVDTLLMYLSHKDRKVRQQAVVALGKTGDKRAVEPLIYALSREFSRGASSYPIIIDILDAMARIPDNRALDTLVKIEAQLVDRNSSRCPAELPAGVITYIDTVDGQIHRVVPRELHFKILDVMRRTSMRLNYRSGEIDARYQTYQDEVIQTEIDRTMPELARVLRENPSLADGNGAVASSDPRGDDHFSTDVPPAPDDAMAGIDYSVIRREMEIEVSEYLRDNERLQSLIRDGQRIKAHMQHTKLEKKKYEAVVSRPASANFP
jgi:PBS lyase HEAT-like repeat